MRFSAFGLAIKLSPSLLLLTAALFIAGEYLNVFFYFAALLLHEKSHMLLANALGYRVELLEIYPFGFSARLDRQIFAWDELCISAAGPLCSLLTGAVCIALDALPNSPFVLSKFAEANLTLGFINLLPAVPLDGGRILRGFLQSAFPKFHRISSILSFILALFLLFFGAVLLKKTNNASAFIMGVFLLSAAISESSSRGASGVRLHMDKRSKMIAGEPTRVRHLAALGDMSIGEAYRYALRKSYTMFYVLDRELGVYGRLDEKQLLFGASLLGSDASLFALVDRLNESC